MNSPVEQESFEDPSLKRVCRDSWGHEKCPLALISRLRDAARQSALQTVQPVQSMRMVPMWYSSGFGIAAAAVVLLTVGIFTRPFANAANASPSLANLNTKIADSMIAMHDKCCHKNGNHQIPDAPKAKVILTGRMLERKLGQPILAAAIPEAGWDFRGGAVCPVADKPAAHLIYKSGSDSISVFSMPRSVSPCSKTYEGSYSNHSIAGFADAHGSYCLVGSGSPSLTPARLAAIRDRIQSRVANGTFPAEPRSTVVNAELLQTYP